jgi:hypothetical protein
MRPHTLNGEGVSSLAIPYYNKFALFPLFDCISTGDMKNIYNKMKDEKVDMLLTESAVKIGLQGGVKYSDKTGTIDAPFNKYTQRFEYLRRQMNTDPEEGDLMTMGTQMVKVALSNLRLGREYKEFGTTANITGEQLLDELMSAINDLSSIGQEEFLQKFFDDAEMVDGKLVKGTLNQKKLSAWMIDQLKGKNTNQNVLKALAYNKATGEMECPIAATSDSTWMESILISQSNKDIIDITPPGSSFVQRSVFAIQSSKKADQEGVGVIQGANKYNGQRL